MHTFTVERQFGDAGLSIGFRRLFTNLAPRSAFYVKCNHNLKSGCTKLIFE
jgi:hypothetical protein